MNYVDRIFVNNCIDILDTGVSDEGQNVRPKWPDGTPAHTFRKFAIVNRYDLSLGLPLLTLRKTNWKAAIDEILWIWQQKSNNVKDLNSHIWDEWADENGTIGKAYGYQLGLKHHFPEGEMDQVDWILHTLKNNPASRRMVTNLFNHADLSDMRLFPCIYSVNFNVNDGKLGAVVIQRSQDMLVANNWNVVQYSALVMMFAKVSGLEPGELVHVITDAHIYDRHIPIVHELLDRTGFILPETHLDKVNTFYNFSVDSFNVLDYQYHKLDQKIPVAI
jgi:thymidylate synthase